MKKTRNIFVVLIEIATILIFLIPTETYAQQNNVRNLTLTNDSWTSYKLVKSAGNVNISNDINTNNLIMRWKTETDNSWTEGSSIYGINNITILEFRLKGIKKAEEEVFQTPNNYYSNDSSPHNENTVTAKNNSIYLKIFIIIIVLSIIGIAIYKSFDFEVDEQYINVLVKFGKYSGLLKPGIQYIPFGFLPFVKKHIYIKGVFQGKIKKLPMYFKNKQEELSRYQITGWFGVKMQFNESNFKNFYINSGVKKMIDKKPKEKEPWFAEIMDDIRTSLMTIGRYLGFGKFQDAPDLNVKTIKALLDIARVIHKLLPEDERVTIEDTLTKTLKKFSILESSLVVSIDKLELSKDLQKSLDEILISEKKIDSVRNEALALLEMKRAEIKASAEKILADGEAEAFAEKIKISKRQQAFADALKLNLLMKEGGSGKFMTMEAANLSAKLVADLYTDEQIFEMTGSDGKSLNGFIEQIAAIMLSALKK